MICYQTFGITETKPKTIIFPQQTHSNNLVEIKTGQEDLTDCDGLYTKQQNQFKLGVHTADCAPIVFWNQDYYGVLHCGWRGLCNNILESMISLMGDNLTCWVGPLYATFEIQKDACYQQINKAVGSNFFEEKNGVLLFHFKQALASKLPKNTVFDSKSTFSDHHLASWRRDGHFKKGQNLTMVEKI